MVTPQNSSGRVVGWTTPTKVDDCFSRGSSIISVFYLSRGSIPEARTLLGGWTYVEHANEHAFPKLTILLQESSGYGSVFSPLSASRTFLSSLRWGRFLSK